MRRRPSVLRSSWVTMLLTMWICSVFIVRTAFGRPAPASSSAETDTAQADSYEQYNVASLDDNATNATDASASSNIDRMPLYPHMQMSRAQFAKISEQAFMSLEQENYVDKPLLSPEEKRNRYYQRNNRISDDGTKLPGRGRKKLPGRRKALAIASADVVAKKEKCEGELFKQRVRMPGCLSKIVVNKFCHGQCASFFIPKLRTKKLKPVFQSCSACVPADYEKVPVTLHCPTRNPPRVTRYVIKVKQCACRAVDMDLF